MDPSPAIPQELIDKIVDDLHDDPITLRACALSSHSLLLRSQGHIFSIIRVSSLELSNRLFDVFSGSPHLSTYIQELGLQAIQIWIGRDSNLPKVLPTISALQRLEVSATGLCSWSQIPRDTRNALMHMFGRSSLVHLNLSGILSIPASFFGIHHHLTDVKLDIVSFAYIHATEVSGMTATSLHILLLDALSNIYSLPAVPTNCALFSQVKVLKALLHPIGFHIINASIESLESITLFEPFSLASSNQDWFRHDFSTIPNLRHLELHHEALFRLPLEASTLFTLGRVRSFITNSPSIAGIKAFTIFLTAIPGSGTKGHLDKLMGLLGSSTIWSEIDQILDNGGRSASEGFRLEVALDLPVTSPEPVLAAARPVWRDAITRQMPLAAAKKILVCDVRSRH